MNTLVTYKVVWVDDFGAIQEIDFDDEQSARDLATSTQNSILYKIQILGSIERLI